MGKIKSEDRKFTFCFILVISMGTIANGLDSRLLMCFMLPIVILLLNLDLPCLVRGSTHRAGGLVMFDVLDLCKVRVGCPFGRSVHSRVGIVV